jgi:uncharacterized protein (TIGR04551 family)
MRYLGSKLLVGIALCTAASDALAQMGPGPMGPGMGSPTTPAGEEKKEGVAEAAPKTPGLLPTTPALPPAKGRRKRFRLLEWDGYYRLRTDWFKGFDLGFKDDPNLGGSPFPQAIGCHSTMTGHPCNDSIGGANMRLRLEPTLNLEEGTSVHLQADVLDNLVLGSTPYNLSYAGIYSATNPQPLGAFGDNQMPPQPGVNSDRPSIVIKRAWGEVAVPLGILKFGRQPNHWGMGIYANGGGRDPVTGVYDYDNDYGDSVDRVSFSAGIPGTPLRAMIAFDWNFTGLASNQVASTNKGNEGHPFDLDDSDDATSYVAVLSKMTPPNELKDALDRGDSVLDYGVYFQYKTQDWDENLSAVTPTTPFDPATGYVPRSMKTYTTSLWGRFGIGSMMLEAELVGQFGSLNKISDFGINNTVDIAKMGGAGRFTWTGMEGKLKLGMESGFATGDQWDNTPQGNTNVAYANQLGGPNDKTLTQFMFNRAYNIDLIMWRHLFGAVTNAAYFKPFLQYDLTKSIHFNVSNVTSLALNPISTPGNDTLYGTEFDTTLGYYTPHFIANISYGVLFPFGAMAHPADTDPTAGGSGFHYSDAAGNTNTGDPNTAHTIQMRLIIPF